MNGRLVVALGALRCRKVGSGPHPCSKPVGHDGGCDFYSAPWSPITKADLARIDRVLAGAPNGYHYPKPRLSRPLPADGSAPKGWTRIADDLAVAA